MDYTDSLIERQLLDSREACRSIESDCILIQELAGKQQYHSNKIQ